MKRKYIQIRRKDATNVEIGIDSENMRGIFEYIGQDTRHKNKFLDIVKVVLEKLNYRHLYRREDISKNAKDITAMRFFVGQENDRIYCKEISRGGTKIVIMGILVLQKKDLSHIEIKEIEKLANYEYEREK